MHKLHMLINICEHKYQNQCEQIHKFTFLWNCTISSYVMKIALGLQDVFVIYVIEIAKAVSVNNI